MSSLSVRSSTPNLHPQSSRPFSTSSSVSTAINGCSTSDLASDDSTGEYGDGNATLGAQVRALQADVADKNRYIATLEKRLLQARRSSQSRTSLGFSPPHKVPGMYSPAELVQEARMEVLLKEKDEEIAELRARLDDKERMVVALRSAARKRDVAETGGRGGSRSLKSASVDGAGVVGGISAGGRGPGIGVRMRSSLDSVAPLRTRASVDEVAPLQLKARASTDSATSVVETREEEDGTF